ncbi:MAG: bifunctional phosphoribosyl-AMP cyclohydrolase/phosphoribosyl-ATP diphosphatase HisIE [Candidatus Bipolaricaulia bacterium]
MIEIDDVRWDADGLVPVIAQDDVDGRVLMLAYADPDALRQTLETGYMHYWSRSRGELWQKGASSGNVQRVRSLHLDCDNDAVLARVAQTGVACHTGAPTCFGEGTPTVLDELGEVVRDRAGRSPDDSYVAGLLGDERRLRQKVGEEAVEVALEADDEALAHEAADLVFHLLVLLFARERPWSDVLRELERRRPR